MNVMPNKEALQLEELISVPITSTSALYLKLREACQSSETTFEDFAKIITLDAGFSARLLKIVNSPFFGVSGKVNNIAHAINILGTKYLTDLALATLVVDKFRGIPKDLVDMNAFWKHCVSSGLGAKIIGKHLGLEETDDYFLAGMLHNIGLLLLFGQMPVKARIIISEARLDKKPLYVVERETLGFDHAEAGGALLKKWNLPSIYVDTALYHNDPAKSKIHFQIVSAVHLGTALAHELKLGSCGEPVAPVIADEALKKLNLSEHDLESIKKEMLEGFEETVQLFS